MTQQNNNNTNAHMIATKKVTWQAENCLSCKWFSPSDPLNADILSNGKCVHPTLLKYDLVVSGRDWCNLFAEISQEQIDQLQEKAMNQKQ
jgi:hypothetical protein